MEGIGIDHLDIETAHHYTPPPPLPKASKGAIAYFMVRTPDDLVCLKFFTPQWYKRAVHVLGNVDRTSKSDFLKEHYATCIRFSSQGDN